MFQLCQIFQKNVAIVSYGCCKSRSVDVSHVANAASVLEAYCKCLLKLFHLFLDICCKRFDLDVAFVFTHMKCFQVFFCKCFIRMFRLFQLFRTYVASVLSGCFKSRSSVAASVSDACFMCFICLQTYVASVASECFKSRSGVASLSSLVCCLPFALVSLPPPPGAGWAFTATSPSSRCWHSHLL
jgi:hypothetical protein